MLIYICIQKIVWSYWDKKTELSSTCFFFLIIVSLLFWRNIWCLSQSLNCYWTRHVHERLSVTVIT